MSEQNIQGNPEKVILPAVDHAILERIKREPKPGRSPAILAYNHLAKHQPFLSTYFLNKALEQNCVLSPRSVNRLAIYGIAGRALELAYRTDRQHSPDATHRVLPVISQPRVGLFGERMDQNPSYVEGIKTRMQLQQSTLVDYTEDFIERATRRLGDEAQMTESVKMHDFLYRTFDYITQEITYRRQRGEDY